MSILTHGVGDPKIDGLFDNEELDQHLFTMDEYIRIAKRMIGRNASPAAVTKMLRDDDAISFVANKLMIGTCRWVQGGKRGNHRGYLSQCGIWAVATWVDQQSKAVEQEWDDISLYHDTGISHDRGRKIYLYEITEDPRDCGYNTHQDEKREAVSKAISSANLDERESSIVDMIYYQNMTQEEVGQRLSISKQRVQQLLARIHSKIKGNGVLDEYNVGAVEI